MSEFKAQINIRASSDMNLSFAFTSIVDSEDEAEEKGRKDARYVSAYTRGYADGVAEWQEENPQ